MISYNDKQTSSTQGVPMLVVVTLRYFAGGQKEPHYFDQKFTEILPES